MFFDCGIHAREWISPAACLQMIEVPHISSLHCDKMFTLQNLVDLFSGRSNSSSMEELLEYQWQFVPVLNPDGYQR